MKSTIFLVFVAFLGLLFVTNPTMDQYEQYVHQQLIIEANTQGKVSQAFGTLFGGVASHLVANATLRHDYIFMSIFEAEYGDNHLSVVGVLNNFIKIKPPASHKSSSISSKPLPMDN